MALPAIRATDSEGNNVLGVGFIGDSAYQTAVKNGFEGTEQEWLDSLRGPQGIPGPVGPTGPKGADGTMSFEELTDEQKEELRGPQGKEGPPGPAGADSTVPGPVGPAGADGYSPTVTITPIDGGNVVTITDETGPHSFNVMNGAQGPQGIQGPAGKDGAQGDQGPAGPQGPKGDTYTITSADYSAIADVVFSKMTNASGVRY